MKKADLITLHSVYNYCSVLQAYATQEIFKKHQVDITIIDYIRPNNSSDLYYVRPVIEVLKSDMQY